MMGLCFKIQQFYFFYFLLLPYFYKKTMLQIFFITTLLAFGTSAPQEAKLDCSDFKTGKFRMLDENKKEQNVTVIRTATTQTESDEESSYKVTLSITWTGDCSYYLEYVSGGNERDNPFKGKKLFVEIVEVKGKMYKYAAWFAGEEEQKIYGWIKKLSNE